MAEKEEKVMTQDDLDAFWAKLKGWFAKAPTAAVTANTVAVFDGTTGKVIKSSGYTIGTSVPANALFTDTTYESKAAASGGTAVSLVTTGEKYIWNSKAAGDHTHQFSFSTTSGNPNVTLSANTKYQIKAGGSELIVMTPPDTWRDITDIYNPSEVGSSSVSLSQKGAQDMLAFIGQNTLADIAWSSNKLTKTKNGTTSDVVSISTIKTALALTKSDVGLGSVGNFLAVSTDANQGLTDTQKSNARANIGAGTSNLTIGTTSTTAAAGNHTHSEYLPKTGGILYSSGNDTPLTIKTGSDSVDNAGIAFMDHNSTQFGSLVATRDVGLFFSLSNQGGTTTYTVLHSGNSSVSLSGSTLTVKINGTSQSLTNTWRPLGTGASDACAGNDSRLSNARPASDVSAWAKKSSLEMSITSGSSPSPIGLAFGTQYALNAGGSALYFTMPALGTSGTTACAGNDSRLSDARPASDVYAWAKAASKPSYGFSEITGTASASQIPTLAISKISGLQTALDGKLATSLKGAANGLAELDANGFVPSSQLPSYVDDVLEYASKSAFPATGTSGKIYVALDTNLTYRWSGSAYTEISPSLALGETSSTAYRGDRGKTAYTHATDASRLTTAKSSGFYKFATTAEGHIASVTAVTASDLTSLIGSTTYAPYNASGYLPLSGGTLTGTGDILTLNNASGGDCALLLKRNQNTAWEIKVSGGNFYLKENTTGTNFLTIKEVSQGSLASFAGGLSATYLRSTVATGTAPLVVASTTAVSNLNADLLDGQHGSYYATASSVTTLQGYFSNGVAKSATKATQDGDGNTISSTYLKKTGGIVYSQNNDTPLTIKTGSTSNTAGLTFMDNASTQFGALFATKDVGLYFALSNQGGTNTYTVLHSGNSSVSLSGSTLTVKINGVEKSLTNTNTTYSANNGVGLSGTTFYNSGVRAATINGNYLRINTNGTNADLTIPYAAMANGLNMYNATRANIDSIKNLGDGKVHYIIEGSGVRGLHFSWDSGAYDTQILIPEHRYDSTAHLKWRSSGADATWEDWMTILDSSNYTSYTVKKDGTGASGTWGINVTGSAGSVAWGNVSGKPSFATVATSGSYNDLSNKPTIPSVSNATITIKQTGINDQTFTLNGSATTITLADTNTWRPLGTGATDACAGNDSRLSNARPASDVSSWAKQSSLAMSLAASSSSGTVLSLSANTQYCLSAGGSAIYFNTPNDTTYSAATQSAAGLMSAADKKKLDGVATGATAVSESTVSGWGFTKNAGTVTSVKVGSTSYSPSSGVVSLPAYPTTLPASDVSAWAKQSSLQMSLAGSSASSGVVQLAAGTQYCLSAGGSVLYFSTPAMRPLGTGATDACAGNDSRLSNARTPVAHASSATTYGVGTTANYGHVKLATGDMNGASGADGVACGKNHTHSQYLPLTGGTIGSGSTNNPLTIYGKASEGSFLKFACPYSGAAGQNESLLGIDPDGYFWVTPSGSSVAYALLHSGNIGSYKGLTTTTFSGTSLSCSIDTYYRASATINTLAVTLPAVSGSTTRSILLYLTTGTSPNITFTGENGLVVKYYASHYIQANKTYEINALYNGNIWIVSSAEIS